MKFVFKNLFFPEETRDMNGHHDDDLKRQRTQYTENTYRNVSTNVSL